MTFQVWGRLFVAVTLIVFLAVRPLYADTVERKIGAMGTMLDISVDALDRAVALEASENAVRAIESVETRLSTWRDDSELAKLNTAAVGQAIPISLQLFSDLSTAQLCWLATDGYFDPAVGALVSAYDLRGRGTIPPARDLERARESVGLNFITLHQGAGDKPSAFKNKSGVILEEGGFGKGLALDDALAALSAAQVTRAVLDFGGQVALLPQHLPVAIAIAHPDHRQQPLLSVMIDGGSLSVSGNSEKGFVFRGKHYGHLLDPKKGRPAADFGSVAVWTEKGVWADCLSTALYAMGPDAAVKWMRTHPEHKVLLILRAPGDKIRVLASRELEGRLRVLDPRAAVTYLGAE